MVRTMLVLCQAAVILCVICHHIVHIMWVLEHSKLSSPYSPSHNVKFSQKHNPNIDNDKCGTKLPNNKKNSSIYGIYFII
jgi:hypothetical protein